MGRKQQQPQPQPQPQQSHDDDESSSTASFEDVGVPPEMPAPSAASSKTAGPAVIKDLVIRDGSGDDENKTDFEDGEVPDVLYVVVYRDVGGRVVDTRQSDKPIDISKYGAADENTSKKPVIEILTRVSANLKQERGGRGGRRNRNHRRDPDYYSDSYDSDSDSDSDNGHRGNGLGVAKVETTEMIIHSEHLKNALSAVVGYYPGEEFIGDRVAVTAPYQVLVHHREALARYRSAQPACHDDAYRETTARHVGVLLGFLDRLYRDKIREEERRHRNDPPAATFELFWILIKPGEVVYARQQGLSGGGSGCEWAPCVVSSVNIVRAHDGRPLQYSIVAWNIAYAGGRLRRRMFAFEVRAFPGEQAIHSLPVVPARFFRDDLEGQGGLPMAEKQVQLGRLYWELTKRPAYKEYDGQLVDHDSALGHPGAPGGGGGNSGGGPAGKISGRVIVDAEGFERPLFASPDRYRHRPPPPHPHLGGGPPRAQPPRDQLPQFGARCSCRECSREGREETGPFANFEDLDPNADAPPRNELYFLVCARAIPAFLLGERRWGHVDVDLLRDVRADREAFKYLVLDDEIKLTVRALIGKFASADGKVAPWPRDLVKNKGEGRIFLLHGSPGVGKTCTAECIAELTHRPLLALTSGDISTDMSAASVERNLHYFLSLGERYGALVLLDEADVYLEARRTKDLHRNGLVSIFLRALEYYRGVLFLTTNRVEAFDAAFTSRIHVALHYRRLTDADRLRVWNNNFERLERDSGGGSDKNRGVYVARSARDYATGADEVRALRLNGREIRNALQTAVALAETEALEDGCEKVAVADRHLQAVVKMSRGFKDFLRRRRGYDPDAGDSESDGELDEDDLSSVAE